MLSLPNMILTENIEFVLKESHHEIYLDVEDYVLNLIEAEECEVIL